MTDHLTIPLTTGFDHASNDGDVSVLTIRRGNTIVAMLTGETAEIVNATMQREAKLRDAISMALSAGRGSSGRIIISSHQEEQIRALIASSEYSDNEK